MLCLACGIEMRLLQVVEDTTMLVSGYEHQTWQCSGCSTVEQRTTFTGKKSQAHRVLAESVSVQPTQTATDELTQIEPAEPTPVLPIQVEQTAQAELTQRTTVESRVSIEETNESQPPKANGPQTSALILPASVLPKTIDERLRYLTKRATGRSAVGTFPFGIVRGIGPQRSRRTRAITSGTCRRSSAKRRAHWA
jgi:hypothetical protein